MDAVGAVVNSLVLASVLTDPPQQRGVRNNEEPEATSAAASTIPAYSCLSEVVKLGNPEIARRLLLRGADPDLKDATGFAILHDVARAGFLDTLQTLLEFQADVNVEDNEGNLPLHFAAQEGHLPVVDFLLERTASRVEHRNHKGATAYDLAKLYKRDAVANLLQSRCSRSRGKGGAAASGE
uniref:Cyclin dependent kinase inhibitor 2C n=1 Tax=Salvator merianae TaxID=96440 RepID=A0A8D0KJS6_SALMN